MPRTYPDPWETLAARLWAKVEKTSSCWIWQGARTAQGYGLIMVGKRSAIGAHRAAWIVTRGPIPVGLHIDHLCRNPSCVNPEHLEPVTNAENNRRSESPSARNARKTSCKRGHPLSGENLYVSNGSRACKTCRRLQKRGLLRSVA